MFKICLLFCLLVAVNARWVPAKITVSADNAYAVFAGDSKGLKYLGSEWATSTEDIFSKPGYYPVGPFGKNSNVQPKVPMYLDEHHALYIVAWSDAIDNQGLLTDVVIDGVQISAENPLWQVYPTGFFAQPTGNAEFPNSGMPTCKPADSPFDRIGQFGQDKTMPPCPDWVKQMIAQADAKSLWQTPTRGDANTAQSFYKQSVTGMPDTSKWMWYNSTKCVDTLNAPFDTPASRCQHQEPLIFRIPVSAVKADPMTCQATSNGKWKYCAGQCPLRPDGTTPQCASIMDANGGLRECECCTFCQLVVMSDITDNYCTGLCPEGNCMQCRASQIAPVNPNDPNGPSYVSACNCLPLEIRTCDVDRCSNKCTGSCPTAEQQCIPDYIDPTTGQIVNCTCPPLDAPCQITYPPGSNQPTCAGTCRDSTTACKGFYVNDILKSCSCDCCELITDLQNPQNNYCMGKCDDTTMKCEATSRSPSGGYITGCDCI